MNVRRLKFFEQLDAEFSDFEVPVTPVEGWDGALRYEIHRIWGHRLQGQSPLLNIWYSARVTIRLR